MSGTSLDFPNSGGLSAPVIFKGGNTSPADNYMRLVQSDMSARNRRREQTPKEEDFKKGLPQPWYKDIPELYEEGEKLKQIGTVMNDPKQPKDVRAKAATEYQHQKGVIAQKFIKSNKDAAVFPKAAMQYAKNPYGHEEGTDKYLEAWEKGDILGRGDLEVKIANDKDAWKEFTALPKDNISKRKEFDELQPDGFSKKRYATTEYNEKAGGEERLALWESGNSTGYRKAKGIVEAQIKRVYPEIEDNHPIEYDKLVRETMLKQADLHSRSQFKPMDKTLIMGAPKPPASSKKGQKSLADMSEYVHPKEINTAKSASVPSGKIESIGSMALPSGIKSRTTVTVNDNYFNPETNVPIKGDAGIVDFSGGEINIIPKKKSGKFEPYVFATAEKRVKKDVPDSNGNDVYENIKYPIAIPLSDVKAILGGEGIQYKWAEELADKENAKLAQGAAPKPKKVSKLDAYTPSIQSGIKKFMEQNKITDEAQAIDILTKAGKIK